jgi:hypothetical protein
MPMLPVPTSVPHSKCHSGNLIAPATATDYGNLGPASGRMRPLGRFKQREGSSDEPVIEKSGRPGRFFLR